MVDEANLHTPICSTFEALVVHLGLVVQSGLSWRRIGPFLLTNAIERIRVRGRGRDRVRVSFCSFWCSSSIC